MKHFSWFLHQSDWCTCITRAQRWIRGSSFLWSFWSTRYQYRCWGRCWMEWSREGGLRRSLCLQIGLSTYLWVPYTTLCILNVNTYAFNEKCYDGIWYVMKISMHNYEWKTSYDFFPLTIDQELLVNLLPEFDRNMLLYLMQTSSQFSSNIYLLFDSISHPWSLTNLVIYSEYCVLNYKQMFPIT